VAFAYRNGSLCAEEVPLEDIARRFGTPCYVYSRAAIEGAYGEFAQALRGRDAMLCYSVKANSNLAVLALLARLGAGFDIVSAASWRACWRQAATRARPCSLASARPKVKSGGAGKEHLLHQPRVRSRAGTRGCGGAGAWATRAGGVPCQSDVDARTHPYISTGLRENKFGVSHRDAERLYAKAAAMPALEVIGSAATSARSWWSLRL